MTDPDPDPRDPVALARALVRCPSITPEEGGALQLTERTLRSLGANVERPVFEAAGTAPVENLFASVGPRDGPHLMFAGHTDVVPPGDDASWSEPPFAANVRDGAVFGRGVEDMKGGVAAFIAAIARLCEREALPGRVSFVVTGDEEGPAINGTVKLLEWAHGRGERFDAAIVGEPTNASELGDTIKVGRRGSLTGALRVRGTQGHAAYPDRADNSVRGMTILLDALMREPLDAGTDRFEPSNLEVTTVDVGNPATNVVPGLAEATFNVRHNDTWTTASLKAEIMARCAAAAKRPNVLRGRSDPIRWSIDWREPASPVFLTRDDDLIAALSEAVRGAVGRTPALATGGGTSDARFIQDYCPVVEFGLVGRTMHQIDERVPVAEIEQLADIYERFVLGWFARQTVR